MAYEMDFQIWGDIDFCEMLHCNVIQEMTKGKTLTSDKIEEVLDYYVGLIRVIVQPHDDEYSIQRFGSHIAIDRTPKCLKQRKGFGERLGVIGLRCIC